MFDDRQPHAAAAGDGAGPSRSSQAELEFRSLLDAAVDAIIVIDHRGRVEQFSLAAERIFGYRAEEVVGCNVDMLMPAPYHAEHDSYIERYNETGEARIIGIGREVRARRKDGTIFPCELAVGQVAQAAPPRFIGFIRDITLRKQAEERLRRSEAELRLAQELANLGNYVIHLDHSEPDYYSPQLHRILGIASMDDAVPLTTLLRLWVHPGDREKLDEAVADLQSTQASCDVEYRIVRTDGVTRHLHHIAQITRDTQGHPLRHVGTIHDVTDRRQGEDEARQLQERLTHFSRLSTMGEMAAGLAHEINQPLSAITMYAQACQRFMRSPNREDDDVMAALEQISAQALRAGEVIRRLRNFVKNREVKREPVDCNRLLDDLRTLAETDARLHNVRLRIEAEPGLPTVYADPIQLQQVVLNLVRNAIDAMSDVPETQREVVLSTHRLPEGEIEVVVADHGSGLAPEATEHLFNPFFTTKAGGTGLGLAISRSIVRAHGGRLWHTPNERMGARFHFTLPVSPAPEGE
ncbi:MAG TPA: PAS domain S-box protein [Steroidobacteraceae bacterium]|nr:PAS domain S-box protein [Steroidobacteraceae bacterium]